MAKGGALLAAYNARRPTRDVDGLATVLTNDSDTLLALIRNIAPPRRSPRRSDLYLDE